MDFTKLRRLGTPYGLTVVEVDDNVLENIGMDRESLVDSCFVSGDTVWVGFYNDEEKRDASFFHEIGHHIEKRPEHEVAPHGPDFKVAPELVAWMLGLREAAKHCIHFSAATLDWALEQALGYRGYQ